MLKKCLKYDFKETFKIWWPFILGSTGSAIATGILFGIINLLEEDAPALALLTIPAMLFYSATIICIFAGTIIPYIRYYTHFFGKERYLTFTLPVKRSTLFSSKVISGLVYTVLSIILPLTSLFSLISFSMAFGESAETILPPIAIILLYLLIILGSLSIALLSSYLVITFCGVFFRKYSLLITIAAFYLLGNFGSIVLVIPIVAVFMLIGGAAGLYDLGIISIGGFEAGLLLLLAAALLAVILALINLLLWVLNLELLERKLNVT